MAKQKASVASNGGMSTLDWFELILANAPAGIGTIVQLKNLITTTYLELRGDTEGEVSIDELRVRLKEKIAALRETQDEINKID